MGAFYALLIAVSVTGGAFIIAVAVLVATGNLTVTLRRGQAKPKRQQ